MKNEKTSIARRRRCREILKEKEKGCKKGKIWKRKFIRR
jgi:hypothetical protein